MSEGRSNESGNLPRTIRVLVVEDNDDGRALLELALTGGGFECRAACNGCEAMELLLEVAPDVIVSDISMPELDGHSFLRRVRGLPGPAARVPAIALTALGTKRDRELAFESGFDLHLMKPTAIADLKAAITGLVSTERRRVGADSDDDRRLAG